MRISRDYVLARLKKLNEQYGGYFGTDLLNLARELKVTLRGLKKRLDKWVKEDPAFASLHYLGMHKPAMTRNELKEIEKLKGWQGPASPVNLSDIRLFTPA